MKNYKLNLREIRESKGITQTELAAAINIDRSVISHYEHERKFPSLERLCQIAKVLNVTLDDLVEII